MTAIQSDSQAQLLNGFVLIDKPAGPTSHAILSRFRKVLGKNVRIGHLGTLDPFATGLLPVLIGGATRLADAVMHGTKQYAFTIGLGHETDTLDPQGRVVRTAEVPLRWSAKLDAVLPRFRGDIEQVPPVYSALKLNGRPLYEYMRATGSIPVDIESKRRNVFIHGIEVLNIDESANSLRLRVICSKGTYVRSLARDIAQALGTAGTCIELRREAVGDWNVESALSLGDALPEREAIVASLQPPCRMRPDVRIIEIPQEMHARLSAGNYLDFLEQNNSGEDLTSLTPGAPLFVRAPGIMFWAEWEKRDHGIVRISPRKRVI